MFGRDDDPPDENSTKSDDSSTFDVTELAERPPGADTEDPYEDVRIDTLPAWWRDAIEEFDRYGMRTYRPPRFADGAPTYPLLVWLEHSLDADIRLVGVDGTYDTERVIRVNGEPVGRVEHEREPTGFTVYRMSSSEFVATVSESVDG